MYPAAMKRPDFDTGAVAPEVVCRTSGKVTGADEVGVADNALVHQAATPAHMMTAHTISGIRHRLARRGGEAVSRRRSSRPAMA